MNINISDYKEIVGLTRVESAKEKKMPPLMFYVRPNCELLNDLLIKSFNKQSNNILVVDPMAGGGSIPLESLRLGLKTIAMDYNPVAYLILKATVEFPAKYADAGLFEETLKAAKEFIHKAREELGKFYGEDAENYIFARGVKCPFCGGILPIQGIDPVITNANRFKRRYLKLTFDKKEKTFHVETVSSKTEKALKKTGNYITCPYCDKRFQLRGKAKTGLTGFDRWFRDHAEFMKQVVEEFAPIDSDMEDKLLSLHIPLVKQVGNEFYPVWEDKREIKKFTDALHYLSNNLFELQQYIPSDDIPLENRWASTAKNKGLEKWYMLFNPRQLLTQAVLSKIVAETAENLASKNGEFGAAVALYLAFAVDKIVDYNTLATKWQGSGFKTGIGNTMRGESTLDFRLEYVEMVTTLPERSLEWALEPDIAESNNITKTAGGILPVLRFLCDEFRGANLGDRVGVYLGDATKLSEILGVGSVDIVNVDPPYFEQVIYSDRSELFWVILRRSLWPVLELLFKPGIKLLNWNWTKPDLPRDREVVSYTKKESNKKKSKKLNESVERYRKLFGEFAKEVYKVLKDDGVLTLWFTHPTDLAWRTIGESLYNAGFVVSKVWPIQTEMKTRYKKQVNVVAQEMSLVIVARKYQRQRLSEVSTIDIKENLLSHPLFVKTAIDLVEDARKVAKEAGASPADTAALMFGSALSVATRFEVPGAGFNDLYDPAITLVIRYFVEPLVRKSLSESGPVKLDDVDVDRVLDYVIRAMLSDPASRSYITLWFLSRVDLETGTVRDTPLGLSYDFAQTTAKLAGYDFERLRDLGLLAETTAGEGNEEDEEESGRKGKAFYPQLFEALSAAKAKAPWTSISRHIPGRAIYLAYLALNESGAPNVRAKTIRDKLAGWSDNDIAEASALAIVLLETSRDVDLGLGEVKGPLGRFINEPSSTAKRELAIQTLLHLIPRG